MWGVGFDRVDIKGKKSENIGLCNRFLGFVGVLWGFCGGEGGLEGRKAKICDLCDQ